MSKDIDVGDVAPKFCLPDQNGEEMCLKDMKGDWIILYFYPKDNTKSCTMEAIDFSLNKQEFEKMGSKILGISPDSVKSHENFCNKHDLSKFTYSCEIKYKI